MKEQAREVMGQQKGRGLAQMVSVLPVLHLGSAISAVRHFLISLLKIISLFFFTNFLLSFLVLFFSFALITSKYTI